MDYKDAGVDIEAGKSFVERIRSSVHSTFRPEVIGDLGGFGGCFQLAEGYKEPVLVSGTDGVGTKLKIAQVIGCHHTVGIDLVAMCVNDVLTSGAEPLFFLDYLATGKLEPENLLDVVAGIADGCKQAGCSLLGGETAEMPGFYQLGEYDLAGFCVGIVEKRQILDGSQVQIGDIVIALPSSGLHSNGYSLVREIIARKKLQWSNCPTIFNGQSLGEICTKPTHIYAKPILAARQAGIDIHAMAHITGGGLPENLPRCLSKGQSIEIDVNKIPTLSIFQWLAETGEINLQVMYDTFNMGVGFVLLLPRQQVELAIDFLQKYDISAFVIGEVVNGTGEVLGLSQLGTQ